MTSLEARREYLRPPPRAVYCPHCIREQPYHRLTWWSKLTAYCLAHNCLLQTGCPKCGAATSVANVAYGRCGQCGTGLVKPIAPDVAVDYILVGSQIMAQSWFGPQAIDDLAAEHGLPPKSDAVLYRITAGLYRAIAYIKGRFDYLYRPELCAGYEIFSLRNEQAVPVSLCFTATCFNALSCWPDGFRDFLDAYRHRQGAPGKGTVAGDFGLLYSRILERYWRLPQLGFVQEAFKDYVADRYGLAATTIRIRHFQEDRRFRERFATVTMAEASRQLGVSERKVKALLKSGQLELVVDGGGKGQLCLINAASVRKLAQSLARRCTLTCAADNLGTTSGVVRDLLSAGLLSAWRPEPSGSEVRLWVDRQSIGHLRRRLGDVVTCEQPPDTVVSLRLATQQLSAYGVTLAGVIDHILSRRLTAYWSGLRLDDMSVQAESIERLRDRLREDRSSYSLQQVADLAGVKPATVRKWVGARLLRTARHANGTLWIDSLEWQNFRKAYVFTCEAAQILGVTQLTVQKWIRAGRLSAVIGGEGSESHRYLLRRADVQRLAADNRLSAPDVMAELGVSRQTLMVLVANGAIQPASGPGMDEARQLLFLRDEMWTESS